MTQELLAVAYCTYIWSCHWRKISFLQMSAEKCLLQFCLQSSYEKLFPFLVANVLLQIIEIVLI